MRAWPKRVVRKMPDVEIPAGAAGEAERSDVIVALEERQHRQIGDTSRRLCQLYAREVAHAEHRAGRRSTLCGLVELLEQEHRRRR